MIVVAVRLGVDPSPSSSSSVSDPLLSDSVSLLACIIVMSVIGCSAASMVGSVFDFWRYSVLPNICSSALLTSIHEFSLGKCPQAVLSFLGCAKQCS